MTTTVGAPGARQFSPSMQVAREIRAEIGRQQISVRQLSMRSGQSYEWWKRRITTGTVPMSLEDIEMIAAALDVPVVRLLSGGPGHDAGANGNHPGNTGNTEGDRQLLGVGTHRAGRRINGVTGGMRAGNALPGKPLEPLELWAQWMRGATGAADKTISTRVGGINALCHHAGTASEPADPLDLTTLQIVAWLAGCDKPWTRRTYAVTARAWHRWLLEQGLRDDDPSSPIPLPPMPKGAPRPAATQVLDEVLGQAPRRVRAYIELAAYEGLRVHEIAKVRGEDFIEDRDGHWLYVTGKGGRQWAVPVHGAVARLRRGYPDKGWWFPSPDPDSPTGHVRAESVSQTVSRAFTRCGHHVTAHQLRHWFGTHTLRASRDLRVTQELMRHESIASTQLYTRVSGAAKTEAIRRLAG